MKNGYTFLAVASFVIVSLLGVTLRMMFVYPLAGVNYQFLLHAHSHFAFSAWVFLALVILISRKFSGTSIEKGLNHVKLLTVISAFGMLVSFSIEGYKAVSISFSTLFIVANFYFSYLILRSRELNERFSPPARILLKGSLAFLCISAIGPFALGPILAAGLKSSPWYHNAIYFYLHFQMNGWMLPAALALLVNDGTFERFFTRTGHEPWLRAFVLSTVPLYFIFTLWSTTSPLVRTLALFGALLNLVSWLKLLALASDRLGKLSFVVRTAILAITVKVLLQVLICIPALGNWVFSQRNLIIGYIHLLLLGAVTPLIFDSLLSVRNWQIKCLPRLHTLFISTVILYIVMLFIQPFLSLFSVIIPHYMVVLLTISVMFLIISCLYLGFVCVFKRQRCKSLED